MKIIMEVPDNKAAFVIELLQSLPFVKARPIRSKAAKTADATTHLLSTEENQRRLTSAIERTKQNKFEEHSLIEE
jgi:hypothetical protein